MSNDPSSEENISDNPKLKRVPKIPEDRYKIIEILGAGGMGVVLKATHVQLNKLVAIKVLNTTNILDESSIQRFELEAQAGSQLAHPNLISVFDYGTTEDGEPFLVMEYVEGKSLWDVVSEEGTLKIEKFYPIFKQIAKAVQFIHKNNIIHRDIKTSNIMIQEIDDDLYAKLLDFGIAKVITDSGLSANDLTATGNVFGSPLYMSPENCLGRPLDNRSDIYSFGCVMYECVSGAPPLIGENVMQTIQKQISEIPKNLDALKSSNPSERSLARVIHKCIEKDPALRYASMAEVIKDLGAAAEEANLTTQALAILQPATPKMTRWTKTESKLPAQSGPTQDEILKKTQEMAKVEKAKANRANLLTSESLFDTQPEGINPVVDESSKLTSVSEDTPELSNRELQQITRDKFSLIDTEEKKGKPKTSLPTWSSPEIIALSAMFFIAGLVFTNPFFKSYYQEIAIKHNLESAEKLFAEGQKSWSKAQPLYYKALANATARDDKKVMGAVNCRLGKIYYSQGEVVRAKEFYAKSLELLEENKEENKALYLDGVIGKAKCLSSQKKYKETEKVLNEALDLAEKWKQGPMKVGDILMLAAKNYSTSRKRVKHAISFYDHAIKEYSKLKESPCQKLAFAWIESAELSARMRWWPDANKRVKEALSLTANINPEDKRKDVEIRAKKIKDEFALATKQPETKVEAPQAVPISTVKNGANVQEDSSTDRGLMHRPRRLMNPRERRMLHRRFNNRRGPNQRFNQQF